MTAEEIRAELAEIAAQNTEAKRIVANSMSHLRAANQMLARNRDHLAALERRLTNSTPTATEAQTDDTPHTHQAPIAVHA